MVGIALFVVLAVVAGVVYLLVGQQDGNGRLPTATGTPAATATTVTGMTTPFAALWKLDGYKVVEAPPSVVAGMRATLDELPPSMRAAFTDTEVRKVEDRGRPVAYVVAHNLDPIVADDPAFMGPIMAGMKQAISGATEKMVGGNPVTCGRFDHLAGCAAVKRGVLLVVVAESQASIEPLVAKLLANIV